MCKDRRANEFFNYVVKAMSSLFGGTVDYKWNLIRKNGATWAAVGARDLRNEPKPKIDYFFAETSVAHLKFRNR